MNTNQINKATSPFPNIKNDMLDRLSKEAEGRITETETEEGQLTSSKTSISALGKAVWSRVFIQGNAA